MTRASDSKPGRGLSLIGYRGTGKTTVGRLVAGRLGLPFLDADAELERLAGRPISEIFASNGEGYFRDLEGHTLQALTAGPPVVLATGGGAILRESNRRALRRFGVVVWLTAGADALVDRLRHAPGNRPALTAAGLLAEIAGVLAARAPLYEEAADAVVATEGRGIVEVADAILIASARCREPSR